MSYDSEIEFLKGYNEWVMEQKAKGVDVSPEAYLLDKAKEQALGKLIKIDDLLREYDPKYDDLEKKIREILDS